LAVPRYLEYPLVMATAAELMAREGDGQNLPVAAACGALAKQFLSALGVN
jgi:hypothetical protein